MSNNNVPSGSWLDFVLNGDASPLTRPKERLFYSAKAKMTKHDGRTDKKTGEGREMEVGGIRDGTR